jgi:hypothetical protein
VLPEFLLAVSLPQMLQMPPLLVILRFVASAVNRWAPSF